MERAPLLSCLADAAPAPTGTSYDTALRRSLLSPQQDCGAVFSRGVRRSRPAAAGKLTRPELRLEAQGISDDFYSHSLAVARDGTLAAALWDRVYLWTPKRTALVCAAPEQVSCVGWDPSSRLLLAGTQAGWSLRDAETRQKTLSCASPRTNTVQWVGSHVFLLGGGRAVRVHDDRVSCKRVGQLLGHAGPVCKLRVDGCGRRVATGGDDDCVRVWDLRREACVRTHPMRSAVRALCWDPSGSGGLAVGGGFLDRRMLLVSEGGAVKEAAASYGQVCDVHWRGSSLVSTHGYRSNAVVVWDARTLVAKAVVENAHADRVLFSDLAPDGSLFTGSPDETVQLWRLGLGTAERSREQPWRGVCVR